MILNLLDRMKLPFRKNKEFLSALYDILGFYPHNIELYRVAFSHKSLGYRKDGGSSAGSFKDRKDRKGGPAQRDRRQDRKSRLDTPVRPLNNERLEYLGDAVIESIVSDILFRHFPTKREGFLTSTRSKIVQRESLNRLATQMGLEKLIIAAQGTHMSHTNIGGNAFEALMGAIYLDRGYKTCHWFLSNRIIGTYIDLDNVAQKEVNFKSKLLEWAQKNRINTKFNDQSDGERGFHSSIVLEGITIGRGSGRSKKESQQEAAKEALTRMRREPKTYDSIFRSKEKRTAMEAEESFALPKIDEIEDNFKSANSRRGGKPILADAPVMEEKKQRQRSDSDEAYDKAYDAAANYEVIDTPPAEPQRTLSDYEAMGIPAPPQENELLEADEKLRKKRTRNRGAKTLGDAVKGQEKGASSAEEKVARREAERMAEVERQRAKAERKRQEAEAAREKEIAAEAERVAREKAESKAKAAKAKADAERKVREEEHKARLEAEELDLFSQAEAANALMVKEKTISKPEKPVVKSKKAAPKEEKPALASLLQAVAEHIEETDAETPISLSEPALSPESVKTPKQSETMAPKPVAQLVLSDEEDNENMIASEAANVTPEVVDSVSAAIADETFEDAQSVIDADNDATESAMEYAHEAAKSVEGLQRFVEEENMESPFAPDDLERAIQAFAQDVVTADEAPTALSVPANTTEPAADKATKETPIAHEAELAAPVSTTTSQASISAAEAEEASETSSSNLPQISFDEIVFSTEHDEHLGEYSATTDTDPAARQHKQNRRRRRPNGQKTSSEVRKELEEEKPTAAGGKKDGEDGRKPRPHRPRRRRPNDKGSKSATE